MGLGRKFALLGLALLFLGRGPCIRPESLVDV